MLVFCLPFKYISDLEIPEEAKSATHVEALQLSLTFGNVAADVTAR